MEKFNFLKDGRIRLPPGFRFQPTDEELVFQYLKCKVLSWPLPASIIPEINVCKYDPWDFPGDKEQEKYFFSSKEAKYPKGKRANRATASGYWKATGVDRKIASPPGSGRRTNPQVVGLKKTLVFYRGKPPHGSRTNWVMHEYRLVLGDPAACKFHPTNTSIQDAFNQLEKWVLCRIHLKKGSRPPLGGLELNSTNHVTYNYNDKVKDNNYMVATTTTTSGPSPRSAEFFDFMKIDKVTHVLGPATSSSSSSSSPSGITGEAPPSESDDQEEISGTGDCNI